MAIKSLAQTLKDLATGIKNTVTTVNKISDIMNIQSGLNPDGSSNGETPGTPTAGATDNTTDHSVIGDIKWSSADLTQAGFLVANGAEVGRATYPDLCAVYEAMGFPWGAGDGSTTFNLPNLIGKFPEGADSAGGYHEAGLPNITGYAGIINGNHTSANGAFYSAKGNNKQDYANNNDNEGLGFDASKSNSIYGSSTTVQPPSALLIPYVKAFAGASVDSTDLAITEVANDVARISERVYLVESAVNDDGSWYRKYSDGWLEQGGILAQSSKTEVVTLIKPYADINYTVHITSWGPNGGSSDGYNYISAVTTTTFTAEVYLKSQSFSKGRWSACGMGAE